MRKPIELRFALSLLAVLPAILLRSPAWSADAPAPAVGAAPTAGAPTAPNDRFAKWEKEIAAFETKDAKVAPPADPILFAGSSTIRMWNVKKSFPDLPVMNRGFGGSEIEDSTHFAPRIILKYKPRIIVFYAGDNDINGGKKPARILSDFQAFVRTVHDALPATKILFLSIKPSLARIKQVDRQKEANRLVEQFCKTDPQLLYVDTTACMLGADGKPRPELFRPDGLHMTDAGYVLWSDILKPLLN